ncbi:hypothetical protein HYE67_008074 [Fusarium culmorum]|uniref:Uncharacterized protein n=1 Tax=Fusarium culmorum TaxID=5516 RepID=A0A2T4HBH0_FUSCU|nr:hypothetical protein FCULG_00002749 [Fusarium culmorum]QPC65843.1 hypothetical protein HYE67_008074 [Fusarium culmorum]
MAELEAILSLRYGHRPFRWGFSIVRTAYGPGSNEQFQKVIAILRRVVQVRTANEAKGVKKNIVYDKEIRTYFKNWIASKNGTDLYGDMRFAACIMIDTETLDQFMTTPEGFPRDSGEGYESSYWLKLVDTETHLYEPVHVRVYGEDDFIKYWFDRNLRRLPMSDLTHRGNEDNPGVLYFGHARPCTMPKIGRYK